MKKLINYLNGTVKVVKGEYIVLECQGIGYAIKTGNPFAFTVGSETTVHTHLYVRDDVIDLYGLKPRGTRLVRAADFGAGNRAQRRDGDHRKRHGRKVIAAINDGDTTYLRRFPGIGLKTSQQIIIDLRGKLDFEGSADIDGPKIKDVKAALKALGYSQGEIKAVIPALKQNADLSVEELLKLALKNMI